MLWVIYNYIHSIGNNHFHLHQENIHIQCVECRTLDNPLEHDTNTKFWYFLNKSRYLQWNNKQSYIQSDLRPPFTWSKNHWHATLQHWQSINIDQFVYRKCSNPWQFTTIYLSIATIVYPIHIPSCIFSNFSSMLLLRLEDNTFVGSISPIGDQSKINHLVQR